MRYMAMLAIGCGRVGFEPRLDATSGDAVAFVCPQFAVFCDDFETGDLSKWGPTIISAKGGMVAPTTTRAHTGAYALEASEPLQTSSGTKAEATVPLAGQSTGMLAVREWIDAPQPLVGFACVDQVQAMNRYLLVCGDNSGNWVVSEAYPSNLDDHHGLAGPSVDTWTCVELDFTFGAPGHLQLYADDVLVVDAAASDPAPMYTQFNAGVPHAANAGFHVFVDDVVIARQHIGCQ